MIRVYPQRNEQMKCNYNGKDCTEIDSLPSCSSR